VLHTALAHPSPRARRPKHRRQLSRRALSWSWRCLPVTPTCRLRPKQGEHRRWLPLSGPASLKGRPHNGQKCDHFAWGQVFQRDVLRTAEDLRRLVSRHRVTPSRVDFGRSCSVVVVIGPHWPRTQTGTQTSPESRPYSRLFANVRACRITVRHNVTRNIDEQGEHPCEGWGSSGRRFKSCQPDKVSAGQGGFGEIRSRLSAYLVGVWMTTRVLNPARHSASLSGLSDFDSGPRCWIVAAAANLPRKATGRWSHRCKFDPPPESCH
jgi:hypothetical protein